MKKQNTLLVVSDGYPQIGSSRYHCQFVYSITELVRPSFREVMVISPQAFIPSVLTKLPSMSSYAKMTGFDDYQYENTSVYYPNFATLPLTYFRDKNHIYMGEAIRHLVKKTKFTPSLVHTHFIYPTGEATLRLFPGVPKILSIHGGDLYEWATKNKTRARKIISGYDYLIVPTNSMKIVLLTIAPQLKDVTYVIAPSIDTKVFAQIDKDEARKMTGIEENAEVILVVANLLKEKGILDAVQVLHRLKSRKDLRLHIIGEGPYRAEIEKQIQQLGLTSRVTVVGSVPNVDLPYWYNSADLLLFPSYEESFGIVQIEAMACNTPVVAYANEGSKTIFEDSRQNLVEVNDKEQLSERVKDALNHPKKYVNKRAVKKYNITNNRDKLLKIYQRAQHQIE